MNIEQIQNTYIDSIAKLNLNELNKKAFELFKKNGLPGTNHEDWIYTKLSDVLPTQFSVCDHKTHIKNFKVCGRYQIVFINGLYSKEDSYLPEGIEFEVIDSQNISDKECIEDEKDTFALLNCSVAKTISKITLKKNISLDDTLSIVHYSNFAGAFSVPRIHVVCEKFSKASFVEIFKGENGQAYNNISVTNFTLDESSNIKYVRVQTEGNESLHIGSVNAELQKGSNFDSFTFITGAKKSRNNITVRFKDESASAKVNGLYALKNDQHSDVFSIIEHQKGHTESSQLFKGILDGASRGVFTGKVLIAKDAQKSNSEQLNKNLLLSKKAHADTRPQLEVYADDVKCGHGATIGQMNPEEEFYLRSRGLSKARVQKLLIHAFCSDVIAKLEDDKIESFLSEELFTSFEEVIFENIN